MSKTSHHRFQMTLQAGAAAFALAAICPSLAMAKSESDLQPPAASTRARPGVPPDLGGKASAAADAPMVVARKEKKKSSSAEPAKPVAAEFKFDEKTNADLAKKLNIPVFFAVPARARATLPATFDTTDKLVDFKHPDAIGKDGDVGLRLIVAKRSGLSKRLAKSGLVQTGDLLLTFRSEWGGAGPYPNIQMGISHTGIAYVKDGGVYHLDNPLTDEYLGPGLRGDLSGGHYREINFLHIIRPRNLTDAEKANLVSWASKVHANGRKIYSKDGLQFNSDYNAPKYGPGKPLEFVHRLGQMALGQKPEGGIDLYCSEFAWSLLALRRCDPVASANAFSGGRVPSCIEPALTPMEATGNYMTSRSRSSTSGLADGPLIVIDSMNLPKADREQRLRSVFSESSDGLKKMSSGHRQVAEQMKPKFAPLEQYYVGVAGGGIIAKIKARTIAKAFRLAVPENYSPTSFLVNTLLPPDNSNRTMDYVATIVFE